MVKQLAIRIKNSLSLSQLASQLDISHHHTRILLNNQIIKSLLTPSVDNRDWLIERKEVKRFLADLNHGAVTVIPENAEIIGFKNLTFEGVDFLSLIRKMLSREILYIDHPVLDTSTQWNLSQFKICRVVETSNSALISPLHGC